MKKAELEQHDNAYQALMYKANAALRSNLYREAIEFAVSAWDHIDGTIQYQRKFAENQVTSIQAIDIVLHYAPLLMDFETLDRLGSLLHSQKRIAKNTGIDWENRLARARAVMWECHQFWTLLEKQGTVDESGFAHAHEDHKNWSRIAEGWIEMALAFRFQAGQKTQLSLVTNLEQVVSAKCPTCATVVKAAKSACLEEHHCPKCRKKNTFVVLAKSPANSA